MPLTWTFGVEAFRGETSTGSWTLRVTDNAAQDDGVLTSVSLTGYGTANSVNDVFHFTDEFMALRLIDISRASLSDTNGGVDWLDAAALTGNLALSLIAGSASSLNGAAFITIASGSTIENAITGDGNDSLIGNSATNQLYGMRGDDTLDGSEGVDFLYGGAGNDQIIFDSADLSGVINGGAGYDRLIILNQPAPTSFNLLANEFETARLMQDAG